MFERVRAVLLTYGERTAFEIFAIVASFLSLLALFVFRGHYISILSYLPFAIPLVVTYSALLGSQLSRQFVPHRARLMPRFASAHFGAVLGLSLLLVVLLGIPVVFSARLGFQGFAEWGDVSLTAVFASLWLFGLIALAAAYFSGPGVVFAFWLLIVGAGSARARGLFFASLSDRGRTIPALFLINVIVSVALIWRIAHVHEELMEHRWRQGQNQPGAQTRRSWWSGSVREKRLDRIARPLKRDIWSQLRHFQLSLGIFESIPRSAAVWIGILWVINAASRTTMQPPWIMLFLGLPTLTVISGVKHRRNSGLQLEFMLPFKRDEIVARLGGALFVSLLRSWSAYALATSIVAWMPIPGVVQGVPSPLPVLASLAAQFPLFGLATIGLMARQVKAIYAAAIIIVFAATFTISVASTALVALFITALALMGIGSIWYSYRRWCQVDL